MLAGEADRRGDVAAEVGWTTSAGTLATMPFQTRTRRPSPRRRRAAAGRRPASRSSSCSEVRSTCPPSSPAMSMVVVVIGGPFPVAVPQRCGARQERFGLLDRRVVAGVVDHVQRPAEAGAGRLGDRQRHLEVVAAPDQGRRNGDPCQVRRRDRRHAELRHEAAERGLHRRACGPGRGRRPPTAPTAAQLLRKPSRSTKHCRKSPSRVLLGRLLHEAVQREPELGAGSNGGQAERVHQHQPASRSPWATAKRAAIAPPRPCPTRRAATGRCARSARPASASIGRCPAGRQPPPRRRGRAGRGRPPDGSSPAPGSPASTGPRTRPSCAAAPPAGRRRPPAPRSRCRPVAAVAR